MVDHPVAATGRISSELSTCAFRWMSRCVEPSAGSLAGRSAAMINYVPTDEQTWRNHGQETVIKQSKGMAKTLGQTGAPPGT